MDSDNNSPEDFQYQLDEFYLDLGTDRHSVNLINKAAIEKRPYPGLRPFKTSEFFLFNGRDGQAEELIGRLRNNHFLAVIGSSGTGKSSLVRSGLVPQLMGGYLHEVGSKWDIAVCRPGKNPIENLAVALARVKCGADDPTAIKKQYDLIEPLLSNTIYGILDVNDLLNPPELPKEQRSGLLILVDQFEELFRFDRTDLKRPGLENQFINLLLQASSSSASAVYVVITMRSEFLGDCVKFRGLPEAINKGQYLVPQLSREQIKKVIEGPISLAGKEIAPGLVEFLVNEIEDSKSKKDLDQLPILQHTMMRTYLYAIKEPGMQKITNLHYEAVGGMEKALANHAQEKFDALGDGGTQLSLKQEVARLVFQALTDSGKDKKGGRRPTELKYLYAISKSINADEQTVDEVINHFRDNETSFIMPPLNTALFPDLMMDISHESLMRQWGTLKIWMAKEQDSAEKFKYYSRQVIDGRELLAGMDLAAANKWVKDQKPNLEWSEKYANNYNDVTNYIARSNAREKKKGFRNLFIIIGASLLVIVGLLAVNSYLKSKDLKDGQKDILSLTREPFYSSGMMSSESRDKWVLSLVKKKYGENGNVIYQNLINGLNIASKAYQSSNPNVAFALVKVAHTQNKDNNLDTVLTNILNNHPYYIMNKVALPGDWELNKILYTVSKDKKHVAVKCKTDIKIFEITKDSIYEIKNLSVIELSSYYYPVFSAMQFTDDDLLVVYSENNIYKWDLTNDFSLTKSAINTGNINYNMTSMSPNGKLLVLDENVDRGGKRMNQVKVLDINSGAVVKITGDADVQNINITSLLFSPDSKKLLVSRKNFGDSISYGVFNFAKADYVSLSKMKGTGDCNVLFTAQSDSLIKATSLSSNSFKLELFDLENKSRLTSSLELPAQVNQLLVSGDGKSVLVESVNNTTLYLNERPVNGIMDFFSSGKDPSKSTLKVKSIALALNSSYNVPLNLAILDGNRLLNISINTVESAVELRKIFSPFKNIADALTQLDKIAPLSFYERISNELIHDEFLSADDAEEAGRYYYNSALTGIDSVDKKNFLRADSQYKSKVLLGSGKPDEKWLYYVNVLDLINNSLYRIDSNFKDYVIRSKQLISYEDKLRNYPALNELLNNTTISNHYGNLSYYQVLSGDYAGAILSAKKGIELYPENYYIYTNMALGYLLSGKIDSAKTIYSRFIPGNAYKDEEDLSYSFLDDFKELESRKILPSMDKGIQDYVDQLKKKLTLIESEKSTK